MVATVQSLARLALQAWADVGDITFRETTGTANIVFDDAENGAFTRASGDTAQINIGPNWIANYGTAVRFYPGVPDPADPSRFTIDYQLGDRHETIDGYLADDDSVTLKLRNADDAKRKW